jgi:hypothetical protein
VKYGDVGRGSDIFCSSWVEYFHNEHSTVFSCGHGEWPIGIERDAEDWVENPQFSAACPTEEHSIFLDSIRTRKETAWVFHIFFKIILSSLFLFFSFFLHK